MVTGEWTISLHLAIFFELFWLDLFPVGTYIPPNASISLLLSLGVARYFAMDTSAMLAVPMALSLPASMLSSKMEHWQRRMQDKGYNTVVNWGRKINKQDDVAPTGRVVAVSLLQQFAINIVFFCACLLVLIGTIKLISLVLGYLPVINSVTWPALWFVAALGAILSLRVRRSYLVCLFSLLAVLVSTLF